MVKNLDAASTSPQISVTTIPKVVFARLFIGAFFARSARLHGFPNTVETYSLVSSIWTSAFALGAFLGPTSVGKSFVYYTVIIIINIIISYDANQAIQIF
jgi:hypothetical protein